MPRPPKAKNSAQKELDKAEKQFETFSEEVKALSNEIPVGLPPVESEAQTKLSRKELKNSRDIYLKPKRTIMPAAHPKTGKVEVFNERYRKDYEKKREPVRFIAENKEIIGETITAWTKPFAGVPAEEWEVPVNKPVWAPEYLYHNIRKCRYTRLVMEERPTSTEGNMTYYGRMIATNRLERLAAYKTDEIPA